MNEYENHEYMIKRLIHRMKQPDFRFLHPNIQMNYRQKIQAHEMAVVEQQKRIMAIKDEFIPTEGHLVSCDFYYNPDPNDKSKTKRVRLPSSAIQWLLDRLEKQGQSLEKIESLQPEAQADMAQMVAAMGGQLDGNLIPIDGGA